MMPENRNFVVESSMTQECKWLYRLQHTTLASTWSRGAAGEALSNHLSGHFNPDHNPDFFPKLFPPMLSIL